MAKIHVALEAEEYYAGEADVDLPWGLEAEDIDDVWPDGYGCFHIWLNDEGSAKAKTACIALEVEWKPAPYSGSYEEAIVGEWDVHKQKDGQFALRWRGEVHMEFDEVHENRVTHWEVEDNG